MFFDIAQAGKPAPISFIFHNKKSTPAHKRKRRQLLGNVVAEGTLVFINIS
jgi:hypothetical protein